MERMDAYGRPFSISLEWSDGVVDYTEAPDTQQESLQTKPRRRSASDGPGREEDPGTDHQAATAQAVRDTEATKETLTAP